MWLALSRTAEAAGASSRASTNIKLSFCLFSQKFFVDLYQRNELWFFKYFEETLIENQKRECCTLRAGIEAAQDPNITSITTTLKRIGINNANRRERDRDLAPFQSPTAGDRGRPSRDLNAGQHAVSLTKLSLSRRVILSSPGANTSAPLGPSSFPPCGQYDGSSKPSRFHKRFEIESSVLGQPWRTAAGHVQNMGSASY